MTTLSLDDVHYPPRLMDLERPPALHVRAPVAGARLLTLLEPPVVAIVGSRHASAGGVAFAQRLAGDVAAAGVCVVSGLARGIDAGAHAGALERAGRTVAVLGCGIDRDYPAATIPLARRISTDGAVVSEYPVGTPPAPFRFPERNRIVAALADVTIVVEAAARSGALITARLALELGREVLVVPGSPWLTGSEGTNALLKDGAIPLTDAADVLLALGLDPGAGRADDPELVGDAARVMAAIRRDPASADLIAARCGLGLAATAGVLGELELAGLIVRDSSARFVSAR